MIYEYGIIKEIINYCKTPDLKKVEIKLLDEALENVHLKQQILMIK